MKAKRRAETRVWHNPHRKQGRHRRRGEQAQAAQAEAERAAAEQVARRAKAPQRRRTGRIVAGPRKVLDEHELERERLLGRVLGAVGRPLISSATEAYVEAGFELPASQELWLQLLEHNDEERVLSAIDGLSRLFDEEPPKRRAVLESRLRRIEEYADERATQAAASALRRKVAAVCSQAPAAS